MDLLSDVVGITATFLPQTTEQQRTLMLVSNTWYRGVIEQDGMKPKPGVEWSWSVMKEQQSMRIRMKSVSNRVLDDITQNLPELQHLTIRRVHPAATANGESCTAQYLSRLCRLQSLEILDGCFEAAGDIVRAVTSPRNNNCAPLHALTLTNFDVTNEDLEIVADSSSAEMGVLNLNVHNVGFNGDKANFKVTDGGIARAFCLGKLHHLKCLGLNGCVELTDHSLLLNTVPPSQRCMLGTPSSAMEVSSTLQPTFINSNCSTSITAGRSQMEVLLMLVVSVPSPP